MSADRSNDEFNAGRSSGPGTDRMTWPLRPGEIVQAAGPKPDDTAPSPPRLGIAAASSLNAWWEVERIESHDLLAADRATEPHLHARPVRFSTTEGGRVVLVFPRPDKPYVAAWL